MVEWGYGPTAHMATSDIRVSVTLVFVSDWLQSEPRSLPDCQRRHAPSHLPTGLTSWSLISRLRGQGSFLNNTFMNTRTLVGQH